MNRRNLKENSILNKILPKNNINQINNTNPISSAISNSKGFSLIECVLATAIIGIVFVSFLSLFSMSSKTTAFSGEKTSMMMAAQDLMEQSTMQEGFQNLNADGYPKSISIRDTQYAGRYDAIRTVMMVDSTANQGKLKKVIIQVKGKDEPDFEKGVMLVTLVGDAG